MYYPWRLRNISLEKEPDIIVIKYLVSSGDYVIDIGANIGLFTSVLSGMVGKEGRVFSIEPIPATFELLCSNVCKLHLENVETINCAISDSEATVSMEIPDDLTGVKNFYLAKIIAEDAAAGKTKCVNVRSATLDSKFSEVSHDISFVKCDVEGHELACIRGGKQFFEHTDAAWLIEISGNPADKSSSFNQIFEILSQKGYEAWWFDGHRLRKHCRDKESVNYFFFKEKHINLLRNRKAALLTGTK